VVDESVLLRIIGGVVGMEQGNSKWDAIRYALDSRERTTRLCMIILVMGIPSMIMAVALMLSTMG
jgi:hypothetical protein